MTTQLLDFDPALLEAVERALEPYKRAYPPEMVEHFRQEARMLLALSPYSAALVQQLQPAPVVQESGSLPTEEGAARQSDPSLRRPSGTYGRGGAR
jgi:hypothetical protein